MTPVPPPHTKSEAVGEGICVYQLVFVGPEHVNLDMSREEAWHEFQQMLGDCIHDLRRAAESAWIGMRTEAEREWDKEIDGK